MEIWKRNLFICCLTSFIVSVGMSQLAPMLPLYIASMGVTDVNEIEKWAGIIFGSNFISLAIFSPIWGRLSDKYGRKPMTIRATTWLGVIMVGMGLAHNVYQLTILRLCQGAMSGFQAAIVPMIAQGTPTDRSGWAMGMFFTSQVSGTLLGPVLGGWMSEVMGFRPMFFCMAGSCAAGVCALLFLKEDFHPQPQALTLTLKETIAKLPKPTLVFGLAVTTFLLQFSIMSIEPIITVYISQLVKNLDHLALIAGAVFSCSGFASMLTASHIGKMADKTGSEKILMGSLLLGACSFLPQGFVTNPWQLGFLRFLLGISTAGMMPSINNLIRQNTPSICLGRIYGLNQAAQFLGMFCGAFAGGTIAATMGIRNLFLITAALLLVNAVWCKKTILK
jgi:DHA1 family multidrug resistance protein-like MFS transporter